MATPIINSIGLVDSVLTIIGFFQSNLPAKAPDGTSVQIKAGLGDDTSTDLNGNINAVYGFDFNNNFIGKSEGDAIGTRGFVDFVIDQETPGIQSDFVSIENGNDATCISWISVTRKDDSPRGAWTGDIGANCGLPWYYGNEAAGHLENGTVYKPKCAWLDGDHTNNYPFAALKFQVRAYGDSANDTLKNSAACSSTLFGKDPAPINGAPAKRELTAKRASPNRIQKVVDRLIMSSHPGESAQELCESETSYGPDFVGVDGMYCDMATKITSPLCSCHKVDGCFEVDEDKKTLTKKSYIARREVNSIHKTYRVVSKWD